MVNQDYEHLKHKSSDELINLWNDKSLSSETLKVIEQILLNRGITPPLTDSINIKQPENISSGNYTNLIAIFLSIFLLLFLIMTNPSKDEYSNYVKEQLLKGNEGNIIASELAELLAKPLIENNTTSNNFVIFTVFRTKIFDSEIKTLGIFKNFVVLNNNINQSPMVDAMKTNSKLNGDTDKVKNKNIIATITDGRLENGKKVFVYPIVNLEDKATENKINNHITEFVNELSKDLINEKNVTQMNGTYKTYLNKNSTLSLGLSNHHYSDGAAHGMTEINSTTLDLENGKLYCLDDLFDDSYYKVALTKIIKDQFNEKKLPKINEFKDITGLEKFYLTDNALVIYFDLYEYTPYAYGIPEFEIPYSKIQNYIGAQSPISRLI